MITADQLVAHAIGDYVLQSDWMASKKRTEDVAALAHALVYSLPFVFLLSSTPWSPRPDGGGWHGSHGSLQWLVIVGTHFLIDRYGLARYVVWAKNFLAPRWLSVPLDRPGTMERNPPWRLCAGTGYPPDRPPFLAVWLLIIADNVLHVLINGAALYWL